MGTSSDIVSPGQLTDITPDSELGAGLSATDRGVVALVTGTLHQEDGTWSVK